MPHPLLFSASHITWSMLLIQILILNDKLQIQIRSQQTWIYTVWKSRAYRRSVYICLSKWNVYIIIILRKIWLQPVQWLKQSTHLALKPPVTCSKRKFLFYFILFIYLFFFFQRKQVLTFHVNCLQRKQVLTFHVNHLLGRWFTWNVKTCFLWKKKKNWMLSATNFAWRFKG